MRHLRHAVVAAVVLAFCVPSVASASGGQKSGDGALLGPARGGGLNGGELLSASWAQKVYAGEDPFIGSCVILAHHVLRPRPRDDGTATCTGTPRTRLFVSLGTACFNVEEGVGETEAEQLACAVGADQAIHEINVTVDNGESMNIVRRRFELFSPQGTVELLAGNEFGVEPQTATFTAHAWGAVIRNLRPGQHTVTVEVVAPDWGDPSFVFVLNIVRGGHSDDDD